MEKCLKCFKNVSEIIKLNKCGHFICCQCLCSYLKDFTSAKILCPIERCTQTISDSVIRMCLSNTQIDLYDALCYAPNTVKCLIKDCPYFVSYTDEEGHFICPICEQPNCITCKRIHGVTVNCKSIYVYDQYPMEIKARPNVLKRKRAIFEELMKKLKLIPNPDWFECDICFGFILPRKGCILRNCLHCFCKPCLYESLHSITFIKNLVCLNSTCGKLLDPSEITALIDEDRYSTMMIKESASLFFQCKNNDCPGMWDLTSEKGSLKCPCCGMQNCIECEDVHQGMSCDGYKKTVRSKQFTFMQKSLKEIEQVRCFICRNIIIIKGGCGSISCNSCGNNTCIFTGKIAGRHNPQICYCQGDTNCSKARLYCGCISSKPCHIRCLYGCFPE